jgi:hypothetical protein
MGMSTESTPLSALRALAERQGVAPTDEDLEAARAFIETVLARLDEIEAMLPPETRPAALYLP